MEYTHLGRTGLKVSRLCLGTMNLFPAFIPNENSFAILDRAVEAGINFIDTANVYGDYFGPQGVGAVESLLGEWFSQRIGLRDKIVLATKVYGMMGPGPNDGGLSAYHIYQACEASLKRLRTDHIDLYQMHHIDRRAPWEEVWQALEILVQQGKVLYAGSSNFAGWHIAQAQCAAGQRHFLGLVCEQSLYNLIDRTVELEVIPACQAYGLGLIPWSPLKSGLLAGISQKKMEGRRVLEPWMDATIQKHSAQLDRYEALCNELGEHPANVALAWLLSRPAVTAPILGPRTVDQLEHSLRAVEIRLPPETLQRLDEIWPGPGGEAPEAYAW